MKYLRLYSTGNCCLGKINPYHQKGYFTQWNLTIKEDKPPAISFKTITRVPEQAKKNLIMGNILNKDIEPLMNTHTF